LDVRTYRGANVDCDHYLVIARLRIQISNTKRAKGKCQQKYDISKLRMPQTDHFSQQITEYLHQSPYSREGTVNEEWETCKGAIIQAADEVLGKTILEPRKTWFDDDCQTATAEKNTAYELMHRKHHTQNAVNNYQENRKIEKSYIKKRVGTKGKRRFGEITWT
jgi:hypothetical protein